jgi:hypothetical protein
MRTLLAVALIAVITGCATEKGNVRQAEHNASQVRMIAVQREAMEQEALLESQERAALYQAISNVAATNPEHSPAALVALAVIGVRDSEESTDAPLVSLQRQQNDALEWTKALAPTVGGLITGVGIAAINAETQRNASDNNRDILLGDQTADTKIVQAVAGLGSVAATQTGIEVGGDYYDLEDSASVDNSTTTSTSSDTTSTDTATTSTTTTTTTSFSLDTTLSYAGQAMTLAALIEQLKGAGATYSIDLDGDGTPDASGGDGTTPTVAITCEGPQFSPKPPQCS